MKQVVGDYLGMLCASLTRSHTDTKKKKKEKKVKFYHGLVMLESRSESHTKKDVI